MSSPFRLYLAIVIVVTYPCSSLSIWKVLVSDAFQVCVYIVAEERHEMNEKTTDELKKILGSTRIDLSLIHI